MLGVHIGGGLMHVKAAITVAERGCCFSLNEYNVYYVKLTEQREASVLVRTGSE
jgi:hypothetical protein